MEKTTTYLDHAGATIPSPSMLSLIFDDILKEPLGNPHSQKSTSSKIDNIRLMILDYFGISNNQYDVIFTSGATASCKLIAESFPFNDNGVIAYPSNAHTSLLGMRCYAKNAISIPFEKLIDYESVIKESSSSSSSSLSSSSSSSTPSSLSSLSTPSSSSSSYYNLLAISGECNFSGSKVDFNTIYKKSKDYHGTDWLTTDLSANVIKCHNAEELKNNDKSWLLFLDAAKLSSTSPLNLSLTLPNFIAVSFYKIFGYPTGLGKYNSLL
jgi:molybdenum cofactor sulfurtransferase